MSESVVLFPGQGAQKAGMAKEFYDRYEAAREVFDAADRIMPDCPPSSLCFEARDEELAKTENTQPALYTACFAVFRVLREKGIRAKVFAGHSLGEYTAATAAGFMSFDDGLRLVRTRGLLMRDCDPERKGGMAAVIGLDGSSIEQVCMEIGNVYPANVNSPSQIVISGFKESVERACLECSRRGAKRTVVLNVSGAFHSPLMAQAALLMEKELSKAEFKKGSDMVVSNATAKFADTPDQIRQNLVRQLGQPVLWHDSMRFLLQAGFTKYIEAGPGGVLKGLFRSISKEAEVFSIEKPEDLIELGSIKSDK